MLSQRFRIPEQQQTDGMPTNFIVVSIDRIRMHFISHSFENYLIKIQQTVSYIA